MAVRPRSDWPKGRIACFKHRSRVLQNNIWSDPAEREFNVYLPAGYTETGGKYVALWDFAAFSNSGPGHLNWKNHGENLPQRLDRLIGSGAMPPVVVPMPDCYSSLGGNQYVNSPAVGRYADYVVEELVPFLTAEVNVFDHRDGRGVFGKSSGGYGALVHAVHYPGTWGGLAVHAADIGFDWVYRPGFPRAAAVLSAFGGDPRRFLEHYWRDNSPSSADYAALITVAMAATYDPGEGPKDAIRLPFDLHTCEMDAARWQRWLAHDPLHFPDTLLERLSAQHAFYIDAGNRDQYNIQYGTRAFCRRLEMLGVDHHFEEFDGTHSGMDWRLDVSLPELANALYAACGADVPAGERDPRQLEP